ncbi:MAG: DUF4384 domain-containing protein [Myxococcota bacterium]
MADGFESKFFPIVATLLLGVAAGGCAPHYAHGSRWDASHRDASRVSAAHEDAGWSTADPQLELEGIRVRRDGKVRRLGLDEPLYTGDELAFDVSTPEDTYLYVVNIAPDGTRHVAYPSLRAKKGTRGPSHWFRLSAPSGQEVVAVVATRRKVRLNKCGKKWLVRTVVRETKREGMTRVQSTRPPGVGDDGHATMGLRARTLRPDGRSFRVEGTPHFAVLLMDIDHRAPR